MHSFVGQKVAHEKFKALTSVKSHICDMKNSRLGHDLPTSVNDSDFAILLLFYFHETKHLQSFLKINPLLNFWNL